MMGSSNTVGMTLFGALVAMVTMGTQVVDTANLELQPRIIGGRGVFDRCKSPYNSIVALQFQSDNIPINFCAAVMLTDRILLTTARCLIEPIGGDLASVKVIVGERDLFMIDRDEQTLDVQSLKLHPQYNPATLDNNIGLIYLSQPARFSACVKPAFKMENDPTACPDIDKTCLMAGWGPYADNQFPTNSRLLRYASVTVYGDAVTGIISFSERNVSQPQGSVYAEGINPANTACFLDWGGTVSCLRNGNYVLRGIISDHNCNVPSPTSIVVVDVPVYQTWIDSCIANWDTCPSL